MVTGMTRVDSQCNTSGDCTQATCPQTSTLQTHSAKQLRNLQESEVNTQRNLLQRFPYSTSEEQKIIHLHQTSQLFFQASHLTTAQ